MLSRYARFEDRYPAECAVRLWNFDRGWVEIGLRELEVKRFESIDDGLGHQQIAEPVFLGGDDVPRSVIGRTVAEGFLVHGLVIVPELAIGDVRRIELPMLVRPLQSSLQ